ncbi:hypothetical protein CS0771_57190 [Catellatospora sp. IY07-71]|uniref:class I SAM-dependent methyltransferase n=1 Tax=Catellatospora sp. IY07-71 TaxID=2728827 RepID=UPI001BB31E6C|nr:class I SAM-dependent methyltransferase [Catellatospora sp. IY07-71]BCJ76175.1 hypothetical protein CS0771_57190 [Catellatospora sp. IY07-71]
MGAEHWTRYAQERPARRLINAAGARTWFNWTQYPDHGPGLEVLNLRPGARVLDLGCGKGGNLAHVSATGHCGVGVDLSPLQVTHAHERWPDLTVVCADALAYLEEGEAPFEAIYSVFGALWFVDPDMLLPAIHRRLRGTLAFSYTFMNSVEGLPRWDLDPEEWTDRLEKHGFAEVELQQIAPPDGVDRGQPTFLMRAVRLG